MQTVKIQCNKQFYQTLNSKKRVIIHQGGSRSGKTYSITQYLIYLITEHKNKVITICRKTLPSLKGSVLRDFQTIIEELGIPFEEHYNKSVGEFEFNKNLVEFISVDQPQKIRGRKRDILFINEANELNLEDFRQLAMRTTQKIILDFNPSDPIHWIYDEAMTRDDAETFISTYKDNYFLPLETIKEIERFKDIDDQYWQVYGLGQRGAFLKGQIFKGWEKIETMPDYESFYGLDWGYSNDPTSLIQVMKHNDNIYIRELIYQKGLTNDEISRMIKGFGVTNEPIYADSAEPKSIKELRMYGLNVHEAVKGKDSILTGISFLKQFKIYLTVDSKNFWREFLYYQWEEDKSGQLTNKPKDFMNHCFDALRYAVYTRYSKPKFEVY